MLRSTALTIRVLALGLLPLAVIPSLVAAAELPEMIIRNVMIIDPGSNDEPYSTMTAQYFYGIGLGNGWQILSGPVITYDWKADSGEKLSVPLGTGIAKTTKFGNTPWRFQLEIQYYIEQPDSFGSDWSITLDIRPVIQNPLLKWFQ